MDRGTCRRRDILRRLAALGALPVLVPLPIWRGDGQARAAAGPADRILVLKAARELRLYRGERLLARYRVALGFDPVGHKQQEGDGRTPEGVYLIDYANPNSRFHRSLHISYPNDADRAAAAARGVAPGGDIMIHGLPDRFAWLRSMHRLADWTAGCIAVTNPEMDEIWQAVPLGTPIEIRP